MKLRNVRQYLAVTKLPQSARSKIHAAYRERDGAYQPFNDHQRALLSEAVFEVENDLESQGGGRPNHPTVLALNAVRNRLYDDLRWNQSEVCPATQGGGR